MSYSYNNFNTYNPYGYNGMPNYQQPMQMQPNFQNVYQNQMPVQQPNQQPQTNYLPLTFVNGIEGAKAYIVPANSVVYLKDSDSNVLFEKRADAQGKYTLIAFTLSQVKDINNIGKENINQPMPQNAISKEDLKGFVTKSDFKEFTSEVLEMIGKLSSMVEKLPKTNSNYQKRGNE